MRIEKLTPSKKHKDVYYLDFEDGSSLRISINHIADYSLFTGRELTEEEYAELRQSAAGWSCMERAYRLIGYRPMSKKELISKLTEKGEPAELCERTAERLEELGIINDGEYAVMIVRHYAAKGYGRMRIKNELYTRGVSKDLWDDALDGLSDQSETVEKLIEMKLKTDSPDKKELKKLTDFLLRRGFGWDEIRPAINNYINEDC